MPRQVFDFDPPERFIAGTVGQPGERTFYLQAAGAGRVVSVALEKQQVAVLAERLEELLDEVRRRGASTSPVPVVPAPGSEDVAPLDLPLLEEFRVGTMALAWETEEERVVLEAQAVGGDEEADEGAEPLADADEGPDVLRVRLSAEEARAFVRRAQRLVAAGRPPCPLCALPVDPEGHICPRQNGHRR